MGKLKITNGTLITPYRFITGQAVWVEKGIIVGIEHEGLAFEGAATVDAGGNYIAPGFIDLHTHGAGGHDFMDGTIEAFLGVAETHARYGTTTLCPTTLASTTEELQHTLAIFKEAAPQNKHGAQMPGLHLEGPYFSINRKGAQDSRFIHDPDPDEYMPIVKESPEIIRWSAAPELKGAMEFGRFMAINGILPSIAHTDAIYEQVIEAFENGFTHVTHLYSGMSGVTRRNAYRYAGAIESAFLIDEMTVEIIADGVHLPQSLLQLICKIKGAGRTALITDSMRAAGLPEGPSILGSLRNGQHVIVEDGVAKLPDRSAFAGSVATADRLVRTMVRLAGVSLQEAVRMMTSTPAKIGGFYAKTGSLTVGKRADIIIFDPEINIQATIVNGNIVYAR